MRWRPAGNPARISPHFILPISCIARSSRSCHVLGLRNSSFDEIPGGVPVRQITARREVRETFPIVASVRKPASVAAAIAPRPSNDADRVSPLLEASGYTTAPSCHARGVPRICRRRLPANPAFFLTLILSTVAFSAVSPPASSAVTAPPTVAAESRAPITTIAGAFARWPELTSDTEPVRLEGVVTGTMPSGAFRIHDGELGIYATKSAAGQTLTAGDRVSVSGVLRKGGFSPWISPLEVTRLGRGEFPSARPASYSLLASGAADNQWVQIEGVVRSVHVPEPRDFAVLDLGMSGGKLRVLVSHEPGTDYESLIDAAVQLRGVAAVNVNAHKHVVEPSFRVPSFAEIKVLRSGQPDPFASPPVPVKRLMGFSPGASHQHRMRISGVVTRQLSETTLFVRDGEAGLKVEINTPQRFQPGERVDVAGFPIMDDGMSVLEHAAWRKLGGGPPPEPGNPTLQTLLDGKHNSDLVSVRARLVDWVIAGNGLTLIFQNEDQLFKGFYNVPATGMAELPARNSVVNVTGICVINELEDYWVYRPRSFVLLIADLADLQLMVPPPWWTSARLSRALVITCVVLFVVVSWVWALRRQVDRKRVVIAQQARHAAALEERSRIARELHDTLEQGLTGLSLQMKALETDLNDTPESARSRLAAARQMLRQSRALARNAIRELRSEAVPPRLDGLIDGLKRIADAWNQSGALKVKVALIGSPRPLPASLENHLLGIGTEAMTNAVKHGRAAVIQVDIAFRAAEIAVRVQDNGAGFDPAQELDQSSGCFGLLGMRERAREIHGELRIQSHPGHGTEVSVIAPTAPVSEIHGQRAESPARPAGLPVRSPAA
jgi:signal transduction histidine kinase